MCTVTREAAEHFKLGQFLEKRMKNFLSNQANLLSNHHLFDEWPISDGEFMDLKGIRGILGEYLKLHKQYSN